MRIRFRGMEFENCTKHTDEEREKFWDCKGFWGWVNVCRKHARQLSLAGGEDDCLPVDEKWGTFKCDVLGCCNEEVEYFDMPLGEVEEIED